MLLIQDIASQHAHFLGVQLYRLRQSAGIQSATIRGQTSDLVGGCSLTDFLAGAALLESQFVVNLKREHDHGTLSITDLLCAHLQKLAGEFDAHHPGIDNWWLSGLGHDSEGEPTIYGMLWKDVYRWHEDLVTTYQLSEEAETNQQHRLHLREAIFRMSQDGGFNLSKGSGETPQRLHDAIEQLSLIQQRGQQCFWEIAAWARRLHETFRKGGNAGVPQDNFYSISYDRVNAITAIFKKSTGANTDNDLSHTNRYEMAVKCAELTLTSIRNDVATFVHRYGGHELSAQESDAIYASEQ